MEMLGLVVVAGLLGGVIGWERELAQKPAGLRTHMIVACSAAMLVLLGTIIIEKVGPRDGAAGGADPTRIIHGIIVGISFLGAGTIMTDRKQQSVNGLTTAASILLSVCIGIAVALHQFVLACGATGLALIMLRLLGSWEGRLKEKDPV